MRPVLRGRLASTIPLWGLEILLDIRPAAINIPLPHQGMVPLCAVLHLVGRYGRNSPELPPRADPGWQKGTSPKTTSVRDARLAEMRCARLLGAANIFGS